MIKEIFHDSFDKCKICKGLSAENNASVTGWQKLFLSFWSAVVSITRRYKAEILRLPNFNMLFQVMLTKFFKS